VFSRPFLLDLTDTVNADFIFVFPFLFFMLWTIPAYQLGSLAVEFPRSGGQLTSKGMMVRVAEQWSQAAILVISNSFLALQHAP